MSEISHKNKLIQIQISVIEVAHSNEFLLIINTRAYKLCGYIAITVKRP